MVTTILVLAAFQGYWLRKLYKDEYRDLRREVDVSFRETMSKLQVSRFEKDTLLITGLPTPAITNKQIVLKDEGPDEMPKHFIKPAMGKTVAANIPQGAIVKGITINRGVSAINIDPDSLAGIAVRSGFSFKGAPNPAVIEMILKNQLNLDTAERFFFRIDSSYSANIRDKVNERTISLSFSSSDSQQMRIFKEKILPKIDDPSASSSNVRSMEDTITKRPAITIIRTKDTPRVMRKTVRHPKEPVQGIVSSSPIINFLSSNKTINDSIPVSKVDSAYRADLLKANRNLPFKILFTEYKDSASRVHMLTGTSVVADSGNGLLTGPVFLGFNTPYSYQAAFGDTTSYILGKMQMQIGGSILLLLLVTLSFIIMYRNMLAQQRLTAIKNDFISNITHELKTPIATVGVAIEALRNFNAMESPERTREYLDISAAELQRLSLLVDKVLKLSMFEKQQLELNKEPFDLKELLNETLNVMRLQFDKHKAVVNVSVEEGNYMLEADKLHITSVIYNLLDNALKYSPVKPQIDVKLSLVNKDRVQLIVQDNGMGIAAQHHSRIFEKFYRVPTGNKHNIKGYGLGLSYVAEVVKSHHGSIDLQSEIGIGSTFIIELPICSS